MRHPDKLSRSILNSISAHIAVLDRSGTIYAVNEAWNRFAKLNGHPSGMLTGIGADYLAVCGAAAARGDAIAGEVLTGIEAVMRGARPSFRCEYPCHAPHERRWFLMNVLPIADTGMVVITHEDISARKLAEETLSRSHEELERRVRERTLELERLNRLLQDEIAERAEAERRLRQAATVFDSAIEAVMIVDGEHNILTVNHAFVGITGYEESEVRGRNPRLLKSGRHDEMFYEALWQSLATSGQWQGEIWNRRKNGEIYPAWESISAVKDADGTVISYVSVFSDISSIKETEERLSFLAHHDPLTGLANRLLFSARLDQALERANRQQKKLALLLIDMDRFKIINDTLGHPVGDRFLQTIAQRLSGSVRAGDTVARLGGDEFALIAEDLTHADATGMLAEKLMTVLSQAVPVDQHQVAASASIGISIYPDDAGSGEELTRTADTALYHAKEEGRNAYRFYRAEQGEQSAKRMAMEHLIRSALNRKQFVLHYQPLIDLATGRCIAVEALIRCHSPEHGLVMPDEFIPLAEETRLIQPMGIWVLRQALRDLAAWRAEGVDLARLAVNLSWRQFDDADFSQQIRLALAEHGLQTGDVEFDLEITESALQRNPRSVAELLRLRERGVRVIIDDFGTGYSSLGQLMKLRPDGLKVDRSFILDIDHDPGSRTIIRAIIALGRSLGLTVVGEGVERQEQLRFLREEGCDQVQGFLFSKAVPAERIPALLRTLRIDGTPARPSPS